MAIRKMNAEEALARACTLPVKFCKCACLPYQPLLAHLPPILEDTASFKKRDYIHIKEEYDDNWWVGRIVGPSNQMVFIPKEVKLKAVLKESHPNSDKLEVYEDAPVMRPIVFLGPTVNHSKLSLLLQAPLVDFMKDKFAGRLFTVECTQWDTPDKLHGCVYEAGLSLDLVYLVHPDFDSENFIQQLLSVKLHPLIVYIEVCSEKVLQKLVQQTSTTSRERADLLENAQLLANNRHCYDLAITDSNLDDACQQLELFLESYWASTRSELLD